MGLERALRAGAPDLSPTAQALADQMVQTWASVARTGVPKAKGLPEWECFNATGKAMRLEPGKSAMFDAWAEYQRSFWKGCIRASSALSQAARRAGPAGRQARPCVIAVAVGAYSPAATAPHTDLP